MGDRATIEIKEEGKSLYFYTHWRGSDVPSLLQAAIIAGDSRWDDAPYLNRIIFQTLIGDDRGTTGFGISTGPCDSEHPKITVDTDTRTVRMGNLWLGYGDFALVNFAGAKNEYAHLKALMEA